MAEVNPTTPGPVYNPTLQTTEQYWQAVQADLQRQGVGSPSPARQANLAAFAALSKVQKVVVVSPDMPKPKAAKK